MAKEPQIMQLLFSQADVVIIGDDVWIRLDEKPNDFANDYEREDILHAEGYDPARSAYEHTTWGRGWAGSGGTGRYPRRESSDGYHFDRARESDPLEAWCNAWSRYTDNRGQKPGHGPFGQTI
jgi:hypothetical protein